METMVYVLLRQDFEELFSEALAKENPSSLFELRRDSSDLAKENFVEYSRRNNSPFYFAQMLSRLSYVGTVLRSPKVKTLGRRRPKPVTLCSISKAKEIKRRKVKCK